jgi:hypothetical protein
MASSEPVATSCPSGEITADVTPVSTCPDNQNLNLGYQAAFGGNATWKTYVPLLSDEQRLVLTRLHIPEACALVARAGHQQATVTRKVKRIDLLLMSLEDGANALFRDVPYLGREGFGVR